MVIAFAYDDATDFTGSSDSSQSGSSPSNTGPPVANPSATRRGRDQKAPHRVLIAEDDEFMRSTLDEILTSVGYSVSVAGDGEAALAALTSEPVDILVLDLHMPRMDGVAVLQQIDAPPPMVVVHSAFEYYAPVDLQRQVGAKVFRYLRKPVAPPQLMSALEEAVTELEGIDRTTD